MIAYHTNALKKFAQTSDERAVTFERLKAQAQSLHLGWNAFGVMFGQLVFAAYDKHVQTVTSGLQQASDAMKQIADGVRVNAAGIDDVNQNITQNANQIR